MNRLLAPVATGVFFILAGTVFLLDGLAVMELSGSIDLLAPAALVLIGLGLLASHFTAPDGTEPPERELP